MKPEPSAFERCWRRGWPSWRVHEVAEEVLERRAGRQHRAHAVVHLGDVGGGGDVDHRRAQPVGELGEALRHEARAGIDRQRLGVRVGLRRHRLAEARGERAAPAAAPRRRRARRARSALPSRRLLCRAGRRRSGARSESRVRRPAGASHAFVRRRRSQDFTPATPRQGRCRRSPPEARRAAAARGPCGRSPRAPRASAPARAPAPAPR